MPAPLSAPNFRYVIRELDEVSVAVSVVGTRRIKLIRMTDMVEPMIAAMVGERPEVKRVRDELRRRLYNLRRSPTSPIPASKAIRRVLESVRDLRKLVDQKGFADVPELFVAEEWALDNAPWGYSEKEAKATLIMLRRVSRLAKDVRLKLDDDMLVLLSPKAARGAYFAYDAREDVFLADLGQDLSGDQEAILKALAGRIWARTFEKEDREVWGGDLKRFQEGFARKLATGLSDSDTAARLVVSVGRYAQRWPEAA